jgi:hypothetical protein
MRVRGAMSMLGIVEDYPTSAYNAAVNLTSASTFPYGIFLLVYRNTQTVAACSGSCQPGTSVHKVHCELHPHVTLSHLITHLGCVYNRSM